MASIKFCGSDLDSALCPLCAGAARVHPASALPAHLEHHRLFFKRKRRGKRGARPRNKKKRKRMLSKGVEFKEGIAQRPGRRF